MVLIATNNKKKEFILSMKKLRIEIEISYDIDGKYPQELELDIVSSALSFGRGEINDEKFTAISSNDDILLNYNRKDFDFNLQIKKVEYMPIKNQKALKTTKNAI